MAKELPYFKFYVAENLLGRISCESDAVQGMFSRACSHYWHKECVISRDELVMKLGRKRVDLLISREYILENENGICIPFLDEQMDEFIGLKGKRSEAGKKGFQAKVKQSSSKTEANLKHLEEIRGDKEEIREDKIRYFTLKDEIIFVPVSEYFKNHFSVFKEQWLMKNRQPIEQAVYEKMDNDYFGYTFNNLNHVQNTFKSVWDKMATEYKNNPSGTVIIDMGKSLSERQDEELKAKYGV